MDFSIRRFRGRPTHAASESPGPAVSLLCDRAEEIELLMQQLPTIYNQLDHLREQISAFEQRCSRIDSNHDQLAQRVGALERLRATIPSRFTVNQYSPLVSLAGYTLKWLFLFFMGFVIAGIISASLEFENAVAVLLAIAAHALRPLTILTLCFAAVVAILESLK